jgi:hypothetical protein
MEDNERKDDDSKASNDVSAAPTKTQRDKKPNKSTRASQKTDNKPKKSLKQRWKSISLPNQLLVIFGGVAAVGGIAYIIAFICVSIWQTNQAKAIAKVQHRPRVIFYRPPVLFAPLTTDVKTGEIHTGKFQVRLKNVETGNAPGAFLQTYPMAIVNDKKTGDHERDEPPDLTTACRSIPDPKGAQMFPMNAGEERTVDAVQSTTRTFPPFKQGEIVGLYWPVCIYYWDDDGDGHGTCLTYRFALPDGQVSFVFGTSPLIGTFQETFMNYCQS